MTFPSKQVLIAVRPDGLLVTVDGVSHMKEMTEIMYIHLAQDCLRASIEMRKHGLVRKEQEEGKEER